MSKDSQIISTIYSCLSVIKKDNGFPWLSEEYLNKYVPTIPLSKLILLKKNEKNIANKGNFDILIARKIRSMEHLLKNNPDVLEGYLAIIDDINDIDAICILLESNVEDIFSMVYDKYCEMYEQELQKDKRLENVLSAKVGINDKKKAKIISIK